MTLNDYIAKYKHEPYDLYVRVKKMLESTSSIKVKETLIRSFDCISVHIFLICNNKHLSASWSMPRYNFEDINIKSYPMYMFLFGNNFRQSIFDIAVWCAQYKSYAPTGIVSAFKKSKFIDLAPTFVGITTSEELEIKLDLLGY